MFEIICETTGNVVGIVGRLGIENAIRKLKKEHGGSYRAVYVD